MIIPEHSVRISYAANVPAQRLVEGLGEQEHALHRRHLAHIPCADVIIEAGVRLVANVLT